jgi:hydrogenase large subunit
VVRKTIFIEPITRIEGHLGVKVDIDVDKKVVIDAHSTGVMFRGLEKIMEGRDPPDAIWISQRICGVCPTPHAIASAEALDMALKVSPPPLAVLLRNLADALEIIYDHTLQWFQLAGPDYSDAVVKERYPSWYKMANEFKTEHREVHGFSYISEIMNSMVPLKGSLWLKSISYQRTAKECLTMIAGKYPHLATVVPGGITHSPSLGEIQELIFKFLELIPWVKQLVYIAEDVFRFLIDIGYIKIGERPANLISYGAADDPELYNAKYESMDEWGEAREVTPGVVIDGKIMTNKLTDIHLGIQEFVTHSFYEEWEGVEVKEDPLGNKVHLKHPWNKETKPQPIKLDWENRYSWVTSPRWVYKGKVNVVEAGPLSRMWTTAASRKVEGSTGKSLKFTLPKTNITGLSPTLNAEVELEWSIPKSVNVIERLRARIYYLAYMAHIAYNELLKVLDYVKKDKIEVFRGFERPKWSLGVGLTEAGRGALGHWTIIKDGKIYRYQVITPSNINASPRDNDGRMGPYEEALMGTPIVEEGPVDSWDGVDIMRTIRSMDPCLACGVTMYIGDRRLDKIINV